MKKVTLFFTVCFLAFQISALPKFGINKLKANKQYQNEFTTYVDASGMFHYVVADGQILLKTKSSMGWIEEVIEFPGADMKNFSVVGSNNYNTELFLLKSFTGSDAKASKIYTTSFKDGAWSTPSLIAMDGIRKMDPIYDANVSADGKVMVLSLDDPRIKGEENLYMSFLNDDNTWTWPQMLGQEVNDMAANFAPYLSPDGSKLYFASDRAGGFGMSDIYVANRLDDSYLSWGEATNMGAVVNSNYDETFYAAIDNEQIWMVKSNISEGALVDSYTSTTFSLETTDLNTAVIANSDLKIEADPIAEKKAPLSVNVAPLMTATVGDETIYFGLNSESLTDHSTANLDQIVQAMKASPAATLNVFGHTCDLGDDAYNMALSKKRAISTIQYLVANGIEMERLTYKAYGESSLASKADRSKNRRVELKVSQSEVAMHE